MGTQTTITQNDRFGGQKPTGAPQKGAVAPDAAPVIAVPQIAQDDAPVVAPPPEAPPAKK